MFSYTVRCKIDDPHTAQLWLDWLIDEHLDDVIAAGAKSAEIFEMEQCVYEVRYLFESENAYQIYEQMHAPKLRLEGLQKFPLELGIQYSRSTGRSIYKS